MNDKAIEILRQDVTIPQIVQKKADEAYDMIREQAGRSNGVQTGRNEKNGLHKIAKNKKAMLLVAAAVMLFAGLTVSAGVRWSEVMRKKWQVEETQKERLWEEGAVSNAMQSQVQNAVTITAEQSIADNYSVYLAFRVEGYSLREGASPAFEALDVTVDGVDSSNYSAGFLEEPAAGDDNSLFYWISMTQAERGWALGKDIHVELTNLCGYADSTGEEVSVGRVDGTWKFDWNLQGTDKTREWTGSLSLGDSGAIVCRVELSPIAGYVEYDWPRKRESRQAVGADGEPVEISRWARAPRMSGIKLEDGTEYRNLFGGDGSEGYLTSDQESTLYYACRGNERIIDPDKVVGLFFENTEGGGFYEIPFAPMSSR